MARRAVIFAVITGLSIAAIWILNLRKTPQPVVRESARVEPQATVRTSPAAATPLALPGTVGSPPPEPALPSAPVAAVPPSMPVTRSIPAADRASDPIQRDAAIELDTVSIHIRDFRSQFGGNPIGTNAEITKALGGDNPRGATFLDGETKNGRGELIDRWGMPYFFHQLSGSEMEVRSAGPDRAMWTPDDLVGR